MFVEQLIKKEEGMISGFLEEGGIFLFLAGYPLLFPYSFYILGNVVSILQNNHSLSRQFTFKYFNNYFSKKKNSLA